MEVKGNNSQNFVDRHIGVNCSDQQAILKYLEHNDLNEFIASVIPSQILEKDLENQSLPQETNEIVALEELNQIARKNVVNRSLIGLGYYGTSTPAVIKRNILENPAWYTAYTPYQAEIAQGRLEALFNFQTLITELTGLPIANASLLDEATAAAEAMSLSFAVRKNKNARTFLVDTLLFPQTYEILKTRAEPLNILLEQVDISNFSNIQDDIFGFLIQLPGSNGRLFDPSKLVDVVHKVGALVSVAIDPLAQVLLPPIGEFGVDIAIGSAQRFGVPMGFGGPHAAFFATRKDFQRQVPGRIVGQSVDKKGQHALRLALQTREQHIRRDKATSNICTAQVLLAILASFYAVYNGPDGLELIAKRVYKYCIQLQYYLKHLDYFIVSENRFDTIEVFCEEAPLVHKLAESVGINLRILPLFSSRDNSKGFGISLDELTDDDEINKLYNILATAKNRRDKIPPNFNFEFKKSLRDIPLRNKPWLTQPVFNQYRSETELIRYINKLSSKDFSLIHGMIPLGSCTMKLNSSAELIPISWKEFASIHPFSPNEQSLGYQQLTNDLEKWLATITGFKGVSLQPNAGSQGEYAGLLVIRAWHKARDQSNRNICLIPTSAHGTNPASAVMTGFKVVPIHCDNQGNIDIDDLNEKAEKFSKSLGALMITYPSTHGVFETKICEIISIVHKYGGQVYLDGANLNAQVGLCRPGIYGADVCHLNLHKTFCIPHGGGGPGVGPIAVAKHLVPYLPGHVFQNLNGSQQITAIAAAPFGSASILPISWMYIRMMGLKGLSKASKIAILSANYIAKRLDPFYPILFKGLNNNIAHECILDLREIKLKTGIEVDDIAKRLMDYGFHAPTVSWPVAGTLMVEPTESESLKELDRFCNAMIAIWHEIKAIELDEVDRNENVLKCAPHTLEVVTSDNWDRPYSRKQAAFPLEDQVKDKFWPAVSRIDNAFGDRNLVCTCDPIDQYIDD